MQNIAKMKDSMIQDIDVVILSGGKSSRMGRDKALLPFQGFDTLIEFQYHKLSKIFENVFISSKDDKFDFLDDKSALITDVDTLSSPMVALKAILQKIQKERVFIITVDIPLVSAQTINSLITHSKQSDIKVTLAKDTQGKLHNLCGVFQKNILEQVETCLLEDIHKINYLVKKVGYEEIIFENAKEFLNINTAREYQEALQHE